MENILWFSQVGKETGSSLKEWDDWPGPDDSLCEPIGQLTQKYFDDISNDAGISYDEFMVDVKYILDDIASKFNFDQSADFYDPRTAAAWEAAWWVGLYNLYTKVSGRVPSQIDEFYQLYKQGCWPYGITCDAGVKYY